MVKTGHDEIDISFRSQVQVHARYRCGLRSHLLSVRYCQERWVLLLLDTRF